MWWWRKSKKAGRPRRRRKGSGYDIDRILNYDIDEEDPPRDPDEPDTWVMPIDWEAWSERDLGEFWHDYPYIEAQGDDESDSYYRWKWPNDRLPSFDLGTGWDYRRHLGDENFIRFIKDDDGSLFDKDLLNIPFFVPYRRPYPPVPRKIYDIYGPVGVLEELDRIEEYVKWLSLVFKDGSTYEGTVFNDMAQGKGVLTTPMDICRYEGEWHQNLMEGHGVLEVDIPDIEPAPNTEFAKEMRAQGKILKADYMSPEDREWLAKDIIDTARQFKNSETPGVSYESPAWIDIMGEMPERGQYRYAGEWKHGRAHGCGVIELNRRLEWGKFYFGKRLIDPGECTDEISSLHASLAEVAAAKARMFVNKPDGYVRELKGPYNDPQHPYMYEEEDVWMAPGFIHQFHEVPDVWKRYVQDVDEEREMWLNSFYKSPLRIPMASELEYWWSNDPEFLVVPNFNDVENESELLLHVPTRQLINWAEDEEGRVRLFWQPFGREVEPEKRKYLPLGFDDFMEEEETEEEQLKRIVAIAKKEEIQNDKKIEVKQEPEESEETKEMLEERKDLEEEMQYEEAQAKLEDLLEDIEAQLKLKKIYEETIKREALEKKPKAATGSNQEEVSEPTPGPYEEEAPKPTQGPVQKREPKITAEPDQKKEPKITAEPDQKMEPKDIPTDQQKEPKDIQTDQEKEAKAKPGPQDSEGGPPESYEEEEEDEDEDEDEDDKPRSFGTVAFANSKDHQKDLSEKTGKDGRSSSLAPTLFASLTMVSKVAAHQLNPLASWIRSKQGMPLFTVSPCSECPGNGNGKTQSALTVKLTDSPNFVNCSLLRKNVANLRTAKVDQNLGCRDTKFPSISIPLDSSFHVLSRSCFVSPKLKKSFGRKKCQENEKRNLQPNTKSSSELWGKMHDIFSLSIPMEYLRC